MMMKTIPVILSLIFILSGCGETTFSRKDRLTVYMIDSPGAAVALLLNYPETKDFDTNPKIVPSLEIPMLGKDLPPGAPTTFIPEANEKGSIIFIWTPKPAAKTSLP